MFRAEIIAWISRPGYHGDICHTHTHLVLRVSRHKHTVLEVTAIHNSTSESAASAHKTCVKSKCGGYGSWYWLVACGIGLSAYVGLAAEDRGLLQPSARAWNSGRAWPGEYGCSARTYSCQCCALTRTPSALGLLRCALELRVRLF